MAKGSMAQSTNHGFARKLASSDKSTRDKAVALLALWLSCQQEISEEELRKIWKGLFYCVWHADKAPVQADLIQRLAGLLETVDIDLSVSFFKVFLSTMRREWSGIDKLRLDKFYLLLREFLSHMFKVLDKGKWDQKLITKFMNALEERAFLARDQFQGLGINLHVIDIFWEEFRKVLPAPDGTLELLLEPFYALLTTSSNKVLLRRLRENIFNALLDDGRTLVSEIERKECVDLTAGNLGYLLISTPVAPRLFDLASSPSIAQSNRKVLYELHVEFTNLEKSLNLFKSNVVHLKETGVSEMDDHGGNFSVDTDGNVGKQLGNPEGLSRTKLRKRQARVAALGVKLPFRVFKVTKVKKAKKEHQADVKKELPSSQEQNDSKAHGKEKDGEIRKRRRGSSVVTANNSVVQGLSDRKVKKANKKQAAKPDGGDGILHDLDTYGSHRGLENCAEDAAVVSSCTDTDRRDINEVTMNLKEKFDIVAAEELSKSVTTSSPVSGVLLETRSKKKRKREKSAQNTSAIESVGTGSGSGVLPPLQHPSNGSADEETPCGSVKKLKKVRFALRNNLVCKPHGPLPPLFLRTPPSATPRGSALKAGVLPGPIRTRPFRVTRGSGLGKSRRRASRPVLTISLQKPKSSARKSRTKQACKRVG